MSIASERGLGLIETCVAASIVLVAALALLPLGVVSTSITENEGHLAARTAEYAQDKMEQLLALAYGDSTTNTTVFPANNSGGTGLAVGGSIDPLNPAAGYVDYLDVNGTLVAGAGITPPDGWRYMRLWQITNPAANLKQIAVMSIVAVKIGPLGRMPRATVVTMKTFPF